VKWISEHKRFGQVALIDRMFACFALRSGAADLLGGNTAPTGGAAGA